MWLQWLALAAKHHHHGIEWKYILCLDSNKYINPKVHYLPLLQMVQDSANRNKDKAFILFRNNKHESSIPDLGNTGINHMLNYS